MKLNKVLLMFLLSVFISTGAFAANQDIEITIDGANIQTDVAPLIINNRTMVPIRAIFEAIGGKIEWNNDTQTAIGTKGSDTIQLQLGNKKASINGREVTLDVAATSINQRTLVPVRFVSESLGASVSWDNDTRKVVIQTLVADEINFRFNKEEGEITAYRYDGPKNVVIPEIIDGVDVKTIGSYAFSNRKLTSLTIPKGIKSIGRDAFSYNKLTSLILPQSITGIGDFAFFSNDLTSVSMSDNIVYLGYFSFRDNNLTSVKVSKQVNQSPNASEGFDPETKLILK